MPGSAIQRVIAVVSAAVLAVGGATAASAATSGAGAPPQYWVATNGLASNANTNCATARYSTVQSAVTAAEAAETGHSAFPSVVVCAGTYQEQVTITKSLNIFHAPRSGPVTIEGLASPVGSTTNCQATDAAGQVPQSVVEICGAKTGGANTSNVHVIISRVTVEGDWPANVCNDNLYGILVEGGAGLNLAASVVENVGADPLTSAGGCQGGVGVEAGNSYTGQIGHVILEDDTVRGYQKNGITADGAGSTAFIASSTVTGAGPTPYIAQNGIQISTGATGGIIGSTISGNNYTGAGEASSTGVLFYGGGASCSGGDPQSGLVRNAYVSRSTLVNNDIGIALFNLNPACNESAATPTRDQACYNTISNSHGYPGGVASADANISGLVTSTGYVGDQAGVSDTGNRDTICHNKISGAGYAPRDATSSLPNPAKPAWVRPVDIYSFAAAIDPVVSGNRYDGQPYNP